MNKGAVLFTNFTAEDFEPTWNSVPYPIAAGQSMMLETGIAETFAKHLIDRELNRAKKPTGDELERKKLWARIFPSTAKKIAPGDDAKVRHDIANANAGQGDAAPKADAAGAKVESDPEAGAFPDLKK